MDSKKKRIHNAEIKKQTNKPTSVALRIPAEIMVQVEMAVLARRVKVPRHTWLLEAIMEKLDKEAGGSN